MFAKTLLIASAVVATAAQLTPTPTPAPGVTHVVGDVSVANTPTVLARQEGTWIVDCRPPATAPPTAAAATPVAVGHRYTIVFVGGVREEHVAVSEPAQNGWFAATDGRRFNLATAISAQEER